METIKIDSTKIILEELGDGKGNIIIASPYGYNFSYYWGSMGSSLKEFLCRIDESYFVTKLSDPLNRGDFDAKASVSNVRKQLKNEFSSDLPWYKFPEAQKSLREELKEIEQTCESEHEFVDSLSNIHNKIDCSSLSHRDEEIFIDIIKSLCNESWNYISRRNSQKTEFLHKLFPNLQKEIKKILKKNLIETI